MEYSVSMGQLVVQFRCQYPRSKMTGVYHKPSPSIIAKRSAAISKSPSALTAVMLGKEGTLKCSPGGKASKKIVSKIHNGIRLEITIEHLFAYF